MSSEHAILNSLENPSHQATIAWISAMAAFSYVARHSHDATAGLRRVHVLITFVGEVVDALMTGQTPWWTRLPRYPRAWQDQLVVPLCWT